MQAHTFTPKVLKALIALIVAVSLLTPIVSFLSYHFLKVGLFATLLPLSLSGIKQGYFWQLFTYPLVHGVGLSITMGLLFTLAFLMFLLFFFGRDIISHIGPKRFLFLYGGATVFAGGVALLFAGLSGSSKLLFGSSPPLLALITFWILLFPDLVLTFFFLFRFRALFALSILVALFLFSDLLTFSFLSFFADLAGVLFGLFFGFGIMRFPLPWKGRKKYAHGKVIDITEIKESDDAFMDRMLDKIGKKGEQSLSAKEKARMRKISEKKRGPTR